VQDSEATGTNWWIYEEFTGSLSPTAERVEPHFRMLKYRPDFPKNFTSFEDAHAPNGRVDQPAEGGDSYGTVIPETFCLRKVDKRRIESGCLQRC
jgi:hypothetical protein